MRGSKCSSSTKLDLHGEVHFRQQIYGCYFGDRDISPHNDALAGLQPALDAYSLSTGNGGGVGALPCTKPSWSDS